MEAGVGEQEWLLSRCFRECVRKSRSCERKRWEKLYRTYGIERIKESVIGRGEVRGIGVKEIGVTDKSGGGAKGVGKRR